MRKWILHDNGSTANLFCNPILVENIKNTKELLELSTNGGDIVTDKRATVPGFGEVSYNPEAITNIFSFAEMENKYRITYDSDVEKAFVVHLPHKKVKFMRSDNGLYYHIPTYDTTRNKHKSLMNHSVESVDENKMLYTNRQVQRAKLTRQIYHAIGTPSVNDFKAIVTSNMV
jgi:hypothetical protein